MKRILTVLLALMLACGLMITAFAASGSVSLNASSQSLNRGDSFTVVARLNCSEPIALGTVSLSYDSSVFEMTGGTCHVTGASIGQVIAGQKVGTFMFNGDPQTVSGNIFTFNMKVKDDAPIGSYTIASSSSIGVDTGESISSGSVKINVTCKHSYGTWTETDGGHQQVCTACGGVNTESHRWDDGTVTKTATCKAEGQKSYSCTVCGASKTESIPKTDDHTFGSLTAVDSASHKDTCSVCQKEVTQAHTWNSGKVTKPATCKDEGEKTYTCDGCKYVKTEKLNKTTDHTYGAWQNVDETNHKHTCSVCQKEESTAHTWNKGVVTQKATCKDEGEKTYTCTACKATKTEKLPVTTTHSWGKWVKADADTHSRVCAVCEKKENGDHSYKTSWSKNKTEHYHECSVCKDQKDAAKHTPGLEATETKAQTCTVCKYIIKAALGHTHNYAGEWTTDESGHWYTCSGCEEKGSYADHSFENTCDPDCADCGYVREASHSYGDSWVTDGENHWHLCAGCGDIQDREGHIPGPEATADTAQSCTVCGYELAPALGAEETEPDPSATEATEPGQQETPADNSFPWWIVIVVLAVAGAAAVLVILKKKQH